MIRNSRRVVALAIAGAVAIAPVISGCGAGSEPQSAAPTRLTEGVNASVPENAAPAQVDIRNMFLLGPKPDQMFNAGASVPLYGTIINQVKGRQDRLVGVSSPDFAQVRITGDAVTLPPARPSGEGVPVALTGQAPAGPPTGRPTGTRSWRPEGSPSAQPTGGTTAQPTAQPSGGATARPTGEATGQPTGRPEAGATTSPSPGGSPAATGGTATAQPGAKAPLIVLSGLKERLLGGEHIRVQLRFEQAGGIELMVPVVPQQFEYAGLTAVSEGVPAPGASQGHGTPAPEGPGGHGTAPGGHGASPSPGASTAPASPAPEGTGGATPAGGGSESPAAGGH
ncbi:hypothetical protein [Actinomadura rugatobispora]|uniref:Copper chaperone PCu(A)C n=1 Tax=Actinomadura rugatobispora TaxID=1994 RepID=A0ABW1AAM4_9ACTN